MSELTPEISQKYLKLCADFFKEHKLIPTQVEVLIQQLEYEWHNTILIRRLLRNPDQIKDLLKQIEEVN